jgi:hypothetical protein
MEDSMMRDRPGEWGEQIRRVLERSRGFRMSCGYDLLEERVEGGVLRDALNGVGIDGIEATNCWDSVHLSLRWRGRARRGFV